MDKKEYDKERYQKIKRNPELLEKKRSSAKRYRKKNRKSIRLKSRKESKELRLQALQAYSDGKPKCECCGEEHLEFLTLDHKEKPKEKYNQYGRSGTSLYRKLRKNGYPKGYRILCFNCNSSLGNWGYCPHNF